MIPDIQGDEKKAWWRRVDREQLLDGFNKCTVAALKKMLTLKGWAPVSLISAMGCYANQEKLLP